MFATLRRSRPRRSSRFVPTMNDLGSRITPVMIIPVESGLDFPDPESIDQVQSEQSIQQQMADLISRVEEMCVTHPADV